MSRQILEPSWFGTSGDFRRRPTLETSESLEGLEARNEAMLDPWKMGQIQFKVEAYGSKGITGLQENPNNALQFWSSFHPKSSECFTLAFFEQEVGSKVRRFICEQKLSRAVSYILWFGSCPNYELQQAIKMFFFSLNYKILLNQQTISIEYFCAGYWGRPDTKIQSQMKQNPHLQRA